MSTGADIMGVEHFGLRLRAARERLGLSQVELADRVGIQQPDLCKLEKGNHTPRLETIEKLAAILGVNPAELAGWK